MTSWREKEEQDFSTASQEQDGFGKSGGPSIRPLHQSNYETRRRDIWITGAMYGSLLANGILFALFGPCMLDVGDQIRATISQMSSVYTVRSLGYLFGSFFGGHFFDRIKSPTQYLAFSLLSCSIWSYLIPMSYSLTILCFVVFWQGASIGSYDTGANVLLLKIWGDKVGPFMQALHCAFGIGAFIAPLIAEPFISHRSESDVLLAADPISGSGGFLIEEQEGVYVSNYRWAYWIGVMVMVPCSLSLFAISNAFPPLASRQQEEEQQKLLSEEDTLSSTSSSSSSPHHGGPSKSYRKEGLYRNVILATICVFLAVYVGIEVSYGAYIFSYAVKSPEIEMEREASTYLTSVYWGFFALGRFCAIFISMWLSPALMMFLDLIGCVASSFVLLMFSRSEKLLWIFSGVFGFSMASIFPSAMHRAETFIDMTGRTTSVVVIGGAVGMMLVPLITGLCFDTDAGPRSFLVINFVGCLLAAVLYAVLQIYGETARPK